MRFQFIPYIVVTSVCAALLRLKCEFYCKTASLVLGLVPRSKNALSPLSHSFLLINKNTFLPNHDCAGAKPAD